MPGKPWWRATNRAWYVTLDGRQIKLCDAPNKRDLIGKEMARTELARIIATQQGAGDDPQIGALALRFLQWNRQHRADATLAWYRDFLQDLIDYLPVTRVSELRPFHITQWVDSHATWGGSSRRGAVVAVKRLFSWAVAEGRLSHHPLAHLKRPRSPRRDTLISVDTHHQLLEHSAPAFAAVLQAMWEMGCRPIEIRTVEVSNVRMDLPAWVFPVGHIANKTGAHTDRPRVTYLTPAIQEMTRSRMQQYPAGPLFRNTRGQPWTTRSLCLYMGRLRAKLNLPDGVCLYAYRHTYATESVAGGTDVAMVAEMLGHTDLAMFAKHYGHLNQRSAALQAARQQALRAMESADPTQSANRNPPSGDDA
jgi:integrase